MTTQNMPVLALRGLTAFPGQTLSFDAEREISILALENAMEGDRELLLVTQREIGVQDPQEEDLYEIGTVCRIFQIVKTSDTGVRVIAGGPNSITGRPCAACGRPSPSCRPMWSCWRTRAGGPRTAPRL